MRIWLTRVLLLSLLGLCLFKVVDHYRSADAADEEEHRYQIREISIEHGFLTRSMCSNSVSEYRWYDTILWNAREPSGLDHFDLVNKGFIKHSRRTLTYCVELYEGSDVARAYDAACQRALDDAESATRPDQTAFDQFQIFRRAWRQCEDPVKEAIKHPSLFAQRLRATYLE